MNRTADDLFQELKKRSSTSSIDENCKIIEKRKSLDHKRPKKPTQMPPSAELMTLDMKSVKVLVERTKFNEMHVVDRRRSSIKAPLPNGGLNTNSTQRGRKTKNKAVTSTSQQKSNEGLFKIRKCYVKIPKDKALIRLQAKVSLGLEVKRSVGRPKKTRQRQSRSLETSTVVVATISVVDSSPVVAGNGTTASEFKRKIEVAEDGSAPKRSRKAKPPKGTEFFINIGSLTRTPSPRRRVSNSNSPKEGKRKARKPGKKKANTQQSLTALRNKFGTRFFKSYVKVKRFSEATRLAASEHPIESVKMEKKKKNLSVSFLETVEILGESSDGEDWMDYEDNSLPTKGSRMRRLENGDIDEEFPVNFSTSTPFASGSGRNSSPEKTIDGRRSGILKRREKISFSPLKENENSPRKEQLKRANEKIVRLRFDKKPVEEEERETVPTQQPETESKLPVAEDDSSDKSDKEAKPVTPTANTSLIENEPETELIKPPPLAKNHEYTEQSDVTSQESANKSNDETTSTDDEKKKATSIGSDKEKEDSFQSALDSSSSIKEATVDQDQPMKTDEDLLTQDFSLEVSDTEGEEDLHEKDEDKVDSVNESTEKTDRNSEADNKEDQLEEEISNTNEVNTSDQHFEDAPEFVATIPLNENDEAERTEAEAVLDDVCQIAAAESAALLNEENAIQATVEYDSQPNDVSTVPVDDDDDFTSVLTHPEVERSLQSAASTLIPNSQEIVVAAAVSSQASVVTSADVDVTEDTFASVVAEVERFTKDVNPEIYSEDVGITGDDVMMDNVQASNSLDDIFDDEVDDDIISSLRMSSGNIDIGHDKSLPIQVIETEVMAIPNEPDLIFDKPLGTTASILGTPIGSSNTTITGHGRSSTPESNSKLSLGRLFQSVKSYVMSPGGDKNSSLQN